MCLVKGLYSIPNINAVNERQPFPCLSASDGTFVHLVQYTF